MKITITGLDILLVVVLLGMWLGWVPKPNILITWQHTEARL